MVLQLANSCLRLEIRDTRICRRRILDPDLVQGRRTVAGTSSVMLMGKSLAPQVHNDNCTATLDNLSLNALPQPRRIGETTDGGAERYCLRSLASRMDTFSGIFNDHAAVSVQV